MFYTVYIATNVKNTVFYTGVTNNIGRRIYEHRNHLTPGFTSKYRIYKLVWCENFSTPTEAIVTEKKIKGWLRAKKIELVRKANPEMEDLYDQLDSSLRSE